MNQERQHLRFLFDPACPWAWRTSLWVRQVARVRPLEIEWDLFSLGYVNRESMNEEYLAKARQREPLLRILELARQQHGNEAIDRLYLALGHAAHERKQDLGNQEVWAEALRNAELPLHLLRRAQTATELDRELVERYKQAIDAEAIGVPTLYFNRSDAPYFGPVIASVPQGEDAGQLWDHVSYLATQPYFYEIKRGRS